jgi:peptide deformylase
VSPLPIRVLGDPILRAETQPVENVSPGIRELVAEMFETMHVARGIGLAAPQVGRTEQLAVVEVEEDKLVLINPEILSSSSGTTKEEEGCLSIPEVYGTVQRPAEIRFRATDSDGQVYEREATGLLARCIQHEIDHLHGKLFIDYLSVLKRRSALAKWSKEREKYPGSVRLLSADAVAEHHHRDEEL